jgi:hypothetical protein
MAARTRQLTLIGSRGREPQQFRESCRAGLVEGRAQEILYGLQIGSAVVPALGKDTAQELIYFPCDLLMDRSSRFFSGSVQPPRCASTGRSWQIFSLTATRS